MSLLLSCLGAIGFNVPLLLSGCSPAALDQVLSGTADLPRYINFTDCSSGLVAGVELPDGRSAWIVGDKDEQGRILAARAIVGVDADENFHEVYLNDSGLPTEFRLNGKAWAITYDLADPANPTFARKPGEPGWG